MIVIILEFLTGVAEVRSSLRCMSLISARRLLHSLKCKRGRLEAEPDLGDDSTEVSLERIDMCIRRLYAISPALRAEQLSS